MLIRSRYGDVVTFSDIMKHAQCRVLLATAIPAGMIWWTHSLAPVIRIRAVHSLWGFAAIAIGAALIAAGAIELIRRGDGLFSNAFRSTRLVCSGVFRWIRNPMYLGFALVSAGVSVAFGSAAGLWFVTPVAGLAAAAFVFVYERHDLHRRFGDKALEPPLLSFPRGNGGPPSAAQRAAVYVWVLFPWLLAFYSVQALGPAPDAFRTSLPFERNWPVLQRTEILYVSAYIFVAIAPLIAATRKGLRRFAVSSAIATAFVTFVWLIVPVIATNRPFHATNPFGRMLALEQHSSTGVAAFPAFHVLWALLVTLVWIDRARATGRPLWTWLGMGWAFGIIASSLTTGMHTVVEIAAAFIIFPPIVWYDRTWSIIRRLTEDLANSWREWRLGPVRFINYGFYTGAAVVVSLLVAGSALGPGREGAVIWIGFCVLIGAGLWAQVFKASSMMLRSFSWYGGIVGGVFGTLCAHITGIPAIPLLAGFAIAAPWIQIFGRLRCLVKGCCYGRPAPAGIGIRYRHPCSLVTRLAHITDVPLYPTPLYSIAGNVLIGLVLIRLHLLAVPDTLIIGLFLILSGIARFVEESYRGEPHRLSVRGLSVYQWLAILSFFFGVVCTALPAGAPSSHLPPGKKVTQNFTSPGYFKSIFCDHFFMSEGEKV
jgi:protein-S-isoprenylcysteine O-methyltransferase Ste14